MIFWYEQNTGNVKFAISDEKLMQEHELNDLWKDQIANELVKINIENPILTKPVTYYQIVNGILQLKPENKWPENILKKASSKVTIIKSM